MKVIVELDLKNHTMSDYFAHQAEWHPVSSRNWISVDRAYIKEDPTDDSFFLFRLVGMRDD